MSLRFFKEDLPELHVIAAGSLLEFALQELPTLGVGRIHSMFMYPMTFDEFLMANGEYLLMEARNQANAANPLPEPLYQKLVSLFRTFILVGGLPEVVSRWVQKHDYLACQEVQDDIVLTYEDDFSKYKKKVDSVLLRLSMRSAALQTGSKFVFSQVGNYQTKEVKRALELLILAGILTPAKHSSANGLPLGVEANASYQKMLLLDSGLMLRLLNLSIGDITDLTTQILTGNVVDLVNKGPMAELIAGLEQIRYQSPNLRHELFFWIRQAKNSQAEVDYVTNYKSHVLPIEVKSGTQGGMKSLWLFMREKKLNNAIRCSLENFSTFDFIDKEDGGVVRHVQVCPIFAISQMGRVLEEIEW